MATTMSAPLSAEPSVPEARRSRNLAPKSYASAAHENVDEMSKQAAASEAKENGGRTGKENGAGKEEGNHLVHESFKDTNGGHLTSVEPAHGYGSGPEQDRMERLVTKRATLVSGRKAGAGWERSG